jgi:hypothetical protein
MTIATDLYNTLNTDAGVQAIVGLGTSPQTSKVYYGQADESAAVPLITFERFAGNRFDTLPGVNDMDNQIMQINCVSTTPELADALADTVYAALEGNGYQRNMGQALYSESTETYMTPLDWSFLA